MSLVRFLIPKFKIFMSAFNVDIKHNYERRVYCVVFLYLLYNYAFVS